MTDASATTQPEPHSRRAALLAGGFFLALAIVGHTLLTRHNDTARHQVQIQWQERLAVMASHQASQMADKVALPRNVVESVAGNVSAQLYLSELEAQTTDDSSAELTFLRNYVLSLADQANLSDAQREAASIRASVPVQANAGLAIVDAEFKPVVGTRHFPEGLNNQAERIRSAGIQSSLLGPDENQRIWLVAPIPGVQADEDSPPAGYAVAGLRFKSKAAGILTTSELPQSPAESYLVQQTDADLRPMFTAPGDSAANLSSGIAGKAVRTPGTITSGLTRKGQDGWAIALPVKGTSWFVVREVSVRAALRETQAQARVIVIAYWLAVAAITFTVVALWRHLTAERLSTALGQIRQHEQLLQLISDHMPARLFIFDALQKLRYANPLAAEKYEMTPQDMVGKRLSQLMGPVAAHPFEEANARVLTRRNPEISHHEHSGTAGLEQALEVHHVPLAGLPETLAQKGQSGVMMIEQDITERLRDKYARQKTLRSLIETIVSLADMRDPHASRHSQGVVMVAGGIAKAMQADALTLDTIDIAGQLMNLGKLFMPDHLLTGKGTIDAGDRRQMAEAMQRTIEYLSHVPFEGPVIDTLRHTQERVDGTGPLHLKEKDLLAPAKILSVANSFVALCSPRSYRDRLPVAEALGVLRQQSGTAYAESVVVALGHYLQNLSGEADWQRFTTSAAA